jgi:hypothetical protein
MAARAYYDAVGKETPDGLYRALLGAALIEPGRFHRCVSFCAHSLRGAYDQDCYEAILEGRIHKVQLVRYAHTVGARPTYSRNLYALKDNIVSVFNADLIQQRDYHNSLRRLMRNCTFDEFWGLLD